MQWRDQIPYLSISVLSALATGSRAILYYLCRSRCDLLVYWVDLPQPDKALYSNHSHRYHNIFELANVYKHWKKGIYNMNSI